MRWRAGPWPPLSWPLQKAYDVIILQVGICLEILGNQDVAQQKCCLHILILVKFLEKWLKKQHGTTSKDWLSYFPYRSHMLPCEIGKLGEYLLSEAVCLQRLLSYVVAAFSRIASRQLCPHMGMSICEASPLDIKAKSSLCWDQSSMFVFLPCNFNWQGIWLYRICMRRTGFIGWEVWECECRVYVCKPGFSWLENQKRKS